MDIGPYMGPIVTALVAVFGFYGMVGQRLAKLEQKMDDLGRDVVKHNSVIERTYKLERDVETGWKRHDELKDRVSELEKRGMKDA